MATHRLIPELFIYGTAFYRPPNPPRAQRREMLRAIRETYKFNLVRIFPGWDYYNPAPGEYAFDDLEDVMGWCDEFGLRVLLGLVLETAPWWLEQAHPETRYVNAADRPRRLQGSGNNMTGGWPGLCLDWEPVRQAAAEYIRALASFARRHPSLYAYDCWNEPHIEPAWERSLWATMPELLYCYCPATIRSFHQWLRERYGTIEQLNEAWVRRYPAFDAIDPPRAMGTYADWVDWRRFAIERSNAELQWRIQHLRAEDPGRIMEVHAAHHPPMDGLAVSCVNLWGLAATVDVFGLSIFPRWFSSAVFEGAGRIEITRSAARGKPFWLAELQGGHGNKGVWRSRRMRDRDIRLWTWLAIAGGARGVVFWTYHAEGTGSEATGFGLVDRAGAPTERVEEAARNGALIEQVWEDILQDYRPRAAVALLTDDDNVLLTYAMSGDEAPSNRSFRGYYRAIWRSDVWADFVEPRDLEPGDYQVLIVPWHLVGKRETCEKLLRCAEAGATVILETAFGLYDERFFHNPHVPPHGLAEAFGYEEEESLYIEGAPPPAAEEVAPSDRVYVEPWMEFREPVAVRVRAHTYLTPIRASGATPIAECDGKPVAVVKAVGRGQVYYFGTDLGAAIDADDAGAMDLVKAILRRHAPAEVTGDQLRPRMITGTRGALLALFNDTARDCRETLAINDAYAQAIDLHSGEELPVGHGKVQVTVPHQSAVVLRLR